MAYSELIKSFSRIRSYMRQFYVFGFRSRSEYTGKSARSYDDERRRIESWLGEYMSFTRDADGKNVFLSVDSRSIPGNPLYRAFRAKSFTDGDIVFRFLILDLLADGEPLTLREVQDRLLSDYPEVFAEIELPEESTLRKKLKEYAGLGLLVKEKRGREAVYALAPNSVNLTGWEDAAAFFSEAAPLGVIGSFLPCGGDRGLFRFKHHYILNALDSEVMLTLCEAIMEDRRVELTVVAARNSAEERVHEVFPLKLYISTQSGRQYILCRYGGGRKLRFFRLDNIRSVKLGEPEENANLFRREGEEFHRIIWGVSSNGGRTLDHIELTVRVCDGEGYILDRLEREKRCGRIEPAGEHSYRFVADVCDALELMPWIRTFIGRIEKLECSNPAVIARFYDTLDRLAELYGGDADALS